MIYWWNPIIKIARKIGIEALKLKEGDVVLDLACGTGPNFKYPSPMVGRTGLIIGLDSSKGMLRKAAKKIAKNKWENIQLIQEDARQISASRINEIYGHEIQLDSIVCVLGLAVIPEDEEVLKST